MSISSNRKLEETSFLNKSNSAFIEQMYLKYINKDPNLTSEWKNYFDNLKEDTSIAIKELEGPSWGKKSNINSEQLENLIFAFNICRYVKSNAIVLVSNNSTIGIGSGQPSRLDSCQIAVNKMKKFGNTKDEIVAASDAFFPFIDGIEKLVQSGVTAVIQPSGSIRDKEIIKFANETNTILVFAKTRHFRH